LDLCVLEAFENMPHIFQTSKLQDDKCPAMDIGNINYIVMNALIMDVGEHLDQERNLNFCTN